jgi:HSP20 family protein
MSWDEFPSWFRRRRWPFWGGWFAEDIDEMMKEFERSMEEAFREFSGEVPRNLIREKRLPDGSTVREFGPFVYGYSMTVGPDGKPRIREFGNVKPGARAIGRGPPRAMIDIRGEREPLVDVMSTDGEVKVIAELPGVEKTDIKLHATSNTLTIDVDTEARRYYKELEMPAEIDPNSAKTSYKNGILEVTLSKVKEKKPKGTPIKIE